jgi:hypothetical protein
VPTRTAVLNGARIVLLGGATALAFFTGGYFDTARAWAGLVTWILVVVALIAVPHPFPRDRSSRVALIALGLLGAWTLISLTWAPVAGAAFHAGQRVFLYAGMLFAAAMLFRDPRTLDLVEPALAAGALVVVGYGISERLLPGLLHFSHSVSAQGRLEQPLTYWNAMGELAAIGFVLSARIAGDTTRAIALRAGAAAACAPLGLGLYLSFSRGALFACAAGVITLVIAAPRRAQLQSALLAIAAGGLAAIAAAPFGGVTALTGSGSTRELEGAVVFVLLAAIIAGAIAAQLALARPERDGELRLPRRAPLIALGLICAGFAVAVLVGAKEGSNVPLVPGAARYETLQSNRYAYWRVALRAFESEPLRGVGAGGWAVWWLRYRTVNEFATDAHSLPLQTAAELGIVGVALLLTFLGGVAGAARTAHRAAPAMAAGPIAGFVVWVAHAPLDWDWQMPAVTLVAIVLAGQLLAMAETGAGIAVVAT